MVARAWRGGGIGWILLNEYKVSAGEDENVLEMDDDNSCTAA